MIYLAYDEIINKILQNSALSRQEIESKINSKLHELQDLVSREGAAHIIANELNIKLFDITPQIIKVRDIKPAMTSVILLAKIISNYGIREYQSNNRKGRLSSFLVGDETGTIRLVIWDENIINTTQEIKEGTLIKIKNAYSRSNSGFMELHLGSRSQLIIAPPGEEILEVSRQQSFLRKKIKDLQENDFIEIAACIVQLFEPRFYTACPECFKKVSQENDSFICSEHQKIKPIQVPIVNIFLDDGTEVIRGVCFREQAEKILTKENFEEVKNELLGKTFILKGRVNKNSMFDRLEFRISEIKEAAPEELIAEMKK